MINEIAYIMFVFGLFFLLLGVPLYYRHIYILRVLSVLFMVLILGLMASFTHSLGRVAINNMPKEQSQEYKQGYIDGLKSMSSTVNDGGFFRWFIYGAIGVLALFPVSAFRKPKKLVKNDKKDEPPSQPRDT